MREDAFLIVGLASDTSSLKFISIVKRVLNVEKLEYNDTYITDATRDLWNGTQPNLSSMKMAVDGI